MDDSTKVLMSIVPGAYLFSSLFGDSEKELREQAENYLKQGISTTESSYADILKNINQGRLYSDYNYRLGSSQDYLLRPDVQNALTKLKQMQQSQAENNLNVGVVTGESPEMQLARNASMSSDMANTVGNIAAQSANYFDSLRKQRDAEQMQYTGMYSNALENKASTLANLYGGAANYYSGLANAKAQQQAATFDSIMNIAAIAAKAALA